jgi:hypothetical protein
VASKALNKKKMAENENNRLWKPFLEWASNNYVNLEHPDDWAQPWECFMAGAKASIDIQLQSELNRG